MISIIIPVYNTEKYLDQCIQSCLNQTFTDFELILINDASTDSSLYICNKYKQLDSRVHIINKSINEGVDKSRFTGLEHAQGKYILFIDSDDWLDSSDVLSFMYEKAEETEADYVEIGMQRILDKHKWIKRQYTSPVTGIIKMPALFDKYYLSFFGINILSINIWGKLYRKSTLEKANLKPTGISMGEDLAFNIQLFPFLNKIYIDKRVGYNYRFGGMTSKYNQYLLADLKKLFYLKEELIEKYHYNKASDFIRIELKNILKSDISQMIYFKIGSKEEIINKIAEELKDPIYQQIFIYAEKNSSFSKEPFVKALMNKDANELYWICNQLVKKKRLIKKIKQILFRLLRYI